MRVLATTLILLGGMPASAGAESCGPSATRSELDVCADHDFKTAGAALNATYAKLMARLKADAETLKLLAAAQRAWLGFRDTECTFASSGSAGGTMHPMIVSVCLANATAARDKQLKAYLACDGDCPAGLP